MLFPVFPWKRMMETRAWRLLILATSSGWKLSPCHHLVKGLTSMVWRLPMPNISTILAKRGGL